MREYFLIGLSAIILFGTLAQWISWRLKLPSILLLLIFGFIAGPVLKLVNPDFLFGQLLFPLISFSVAVILFEGGLSLRISELRQVGQVVRNLITVGVLVTWVFATLASHFILKLDLQLALLFGAILTVTGPTVIIPLLREVRPSGQLNSILKWEGIMNDPIGAVLAVLVFESILAGGFAEVTTVMFGGLLKTVILGSLLGIFGAYLLVWLLRSRLLPDYLVNPSSLMMVFFVFTASNLTQAESGLLAVTIMGIALANQKKVSLQHIMEFKETLRVLLISVLFIILAARLKFTDLQWLGTNSFIFLSVLIFLVRPAAVLISTSRSAVSWKERLFLSWMAPRGVVAAAVTSLFALELSNRGITRADQLVPLIFLVIIGTISIYGLTAAPLAKWLGIANVNPQGCLIIGAHTFGRAIARVLKQQGFAVILVDTNYNNLMMARMEGLTTHYGSVLSETILEDLDLNGIGRLLAITANNEVNSLATLYFSKVFGSNEVYQLAITEDKQKSAQTVTKELRGQFLFSPTFTSDYLLQHLGAEPVIKTTPFTKEFTYEQFLNQFGKDHFIPLFLIGSNKNLMIFTERDQPLPKPGDILIYLVTKFDTSNALYKSEDKKVDHESTN